MKIAILYEILGRSKGGIEAWIYHASEELLNQGHSVTIFCTQVSIPNDSAPTGVDIVSLKPARRLPVFYFLKSTYSLKKQLKNILHNYDAVWARSFTMAYAASRILGKGKAIYINAAPYSFYGQVSFFQRFKEFSGFLGFIHVFTSEIALQISYLLEKSAIINCSNVYLSETRRDETLDFFKLDRKSIYCKVIPAGVNTERFSPSTFIWEGKSPLKLISVCRLEFDKNIQCVIRAVSELINENIPVRLTIAGEGTYGFNLKKLVDDLHINRHIDFVGRQENIEELYRNNHVFILPSLYEGFGSVYIEAMACGLPCIAISKKKSDLKVAADEIIEDNITGLLMEENDHMELSALIKSIYLDKKLLNRLSEYSRKKAVSDYKWELTIKKLLNLL